MPRELRDLGQTIELRRPRRRRWLVPVVAALVVVAAVTARAADEQDPGLDELVRPAEPAIAAGAGEAQAPPKSADAAAVAEPAVALPVLGHVGDLLLHVPAEEAVLVSYHEAAFPEAMPIQPLGHLLANENPTRQLAHDEDPDGVGFHVQVSRGRTNASTSAVDVVLQAGEEVRAPVSGTVTEVRPYQLYGTHDDIRIELAPDGHPDRAVVLIHVRDVIVRAGDRIEVGDVLAGAARQFPFSAVVDRQTEPDRHGHVHIEVKRPTELTEPTG